MGRAGDSQCHKGRQWTRRVVVGSCAGLMVLAMTACASIGPPWQSMQLHPVQRTLTPGDAQFFAAGYSQDEEYFKSYVKRAQYAYLANGNDRVWQGLSGGISVLFGAQTWPAPFSVRWELKDGRKFMVDFIDSSAYAAEFRSRMWVPLQHHRENRQRVDWDGSPQLMVEVWEDMAFLKWHIRLNLTPPSQRMPAVPYHQAKPNNYTFEEYVIAKVKGREVSYINFDDRWEITPAKGAVR